MGISTAPDTQVIIVGGGIGGLTLGAILHKLKISCIILERYDKITPVGAGISLAPNALRALDQLGLYDKIHKNSQELHRIRIHGAKREWRSLDFGLAKRWFGYKVHSIERHEFHRLLSDAACMEETVQLNSEVIDIVQDVSKPYVTVKLAGGRQLTADVVVGADGIRSVTRRILAKNAGCDAINTIRFTGRVHMSGYTAPLENLGKEDLGVGNWLLYEDSILTTWPCKDNRQWFIGVKKAEVRNGETVDRSVWKGTTASMVNDVYGEKYHPFGVHGKVSDIVNHSERVIASNVFEEKDFPSMVSGRVALLGDAAHSMTSFFGQGACQAIEDAVELSNALQQYFFASSRSESSQVCIQNALNEYSTSRERRSRSLVAFSENYAKLHTANLPYGLGPLVRKFCFAYLPAWVWMWGLKWLYGYQPVVQNLPVSDEAEKNVLLH